MVWAIVFPSEFNEFSPRGEFRGYKEALAAHYKAERRPGLTPRHPPQYVFTSERPVDGDGNPYPFFQRYVLDVSEKFHSEIGDRSRHDPPLQPVQPHEWPTEYVYARTYKRQAAMMEGPNRMFFVTEPLPDILEGLEPGVHQFNPIRVVLPKGEDHPVRHHMMIVGRWLDAFRLDESDPDSLHIDGQPPRVKPRYKEDFRGVAMSKAEIGNAHLWRERRLLPATFYMSDTLKDEADKAGLRLPPHFRMRLV
jgi:hypothetical protein